MTRWLTVLTLALPTVASAQDGVDARVDGVIAEYDAEYAAWYERYVAEYPEATEEEQAALVGAIPRTQPYGVRLMELAAEAPRAPGPSWPASGCSGTSVKASP